MKPPEIRQLCPWTQVFDMTVSLAFDRDILGFEIVQQSSPGDNCDWVWLKRDAAELMVNTMFCPQVIAVQTTHDSKRDTLGE